jgi:hypothetical protein
MSRLHIMFDLETLSTRSNAVIVQIGALSFYDDDLEIRPWRQDEVFSAKISIDDCLKHGLVIDEGALRFWLFQPEEARESVFKGQSKPLQTVLSNFNRWLRDVIADNKDYRVWCHPDFDLPILRNAFNACGLGSHFPLNHRKSRDLRTVLEDTWGEKHNYPQVERLGPLHDALSDTMVQADQLKLTLAELARHHAIVADYDHAVVADFDTNDPCQFRR